MRSVRWYSVCTAVLAVVCCASGCTHKEKLAVRTTAEVLTPSRAPHQLKPSPRSGGSRTYVPIQRRRAQTAEPGAAATMGTEIETAPAPTPLGTAGGWSVSESTVPNEPPPSHVAPLPHPDPPAGDRSPGHAWAWGIIAIVVIVAAGVASVFLRRIET